MAKVNRSNLFKESYAPFKKYWQFLLANILLGVLITVVFWSGPNPDIKMMGYAVIWSFAISFTQWSGIALLSGYIDNYVDWLEEPIKRMVLGIVSTAVYSVLAYLIVQLALKGIFFGEFPDDLWAWVLRIYKTPVILSLVITGIFVTVGFFNSWRSSKINADKYQAKMMTYKYEALRNQINPHFLFNSFNVLSDLVYEDQDLASKFIQQLGELYRYVLDSRDKELVALSEEMEFIESYLFLLKIRFEDKLQVELKLSPEPDQILVPMSLQLLIENAVKHNEVSTARPLRIYLEQEGDSIVVRNSLCVKNVGSDSKKTGLKNIKDQYALWTEREIDISETAEEFKVRIPLLRRTSK